MNVPPEILRNDQVELRRWRAADLDALDRAIHESLDHLRPWMPWAASHDRRQATEFLARNETEWREGEAFGYAVTVRGALVGGCGLMRRIGAGGLDIGYWIHPDWTRRGLATMAAGALTGEAFRLTGIDRVEIHHDAANPASGAVALRLGFTEVSRAPDPEGPSAPGEAGVKVAWRTTVDQWRARSAEPVRGTH
ncbi:GNAT family N-acetyltransferase [Streptomyces sp. NPDC005438]|uniref:GNAT family N-acetyltransferase n=1 Tax=Streptomyces sp. NPDC005438 TaxID=3156880 RepID=UPI0033AAA057